MTQDLHKKLLKIWDTNYAKEKIPQILEKAFIDAGYMSPAMLEEYVQDKIWHATIGAE